MSSVCPHGKVRLLLDGFSWSTIFELFCFENLSRKSNFHKNPTRVTGTSREKVFTSVTVSCWIVLRMSSVSDKSCRENGNTHIMLSNFFPENRSVCDLKKCGGARQVTDDNIIRRLWFACWITKTIDTHTRVVPIAFPRQQWFREPALILHYTYIASLVLYCVHWQQLFESY